MGKSGKSDTRTSGHTGQCPALSGVWQPDGHGQIPRGMSCLSGLSGASRALLSHGTSGQRDRHPGMANRISQRRPLVLTKRAASSRRVREIETANRIKHDG